MVYVAGKMRSEQLPSFLDCEASSLDGYPIEVAISTADGESRSWLIRPTWRWTDWSPKAERLHGMSHAGHLIPDVPGRITAIESEARQRAGPRIARPATWRTSSNCTVWRPTPSGRLRCPELAHLKRARRYSGKESRPGDVADRFALRYRLNG